MACFRINGALFEKLSSPSDSFLPLNSRSELHSRSFGSRLTLVDMPAPQPVYPSFTFVITNAEHSSFRLPAYRSAHVGRYHPYPRPPTRTVPDYLMVSD